MLAEYIESDDYELDLLATKQLWEHPKALGIAGMFIFLSYATIPDLIKVHPLVGQPRVSTMRLGLDSEREKRFLLGVLGLRQDEGWQGGLRNPRVQDSIRVLCTQHLAFVGMQQNYMGFFAGIIALSILRTYNTYNWVRDREIQTRYWRYITYVSLLLNVELDNNADEEFSCAKFIEDHSSPSSDGQHIVAALREVYPVYFDLCLPVLFSTSAQVVAQLFACR